MYLGFKFLFLQVSLVTNLKKKFSSIHFFKFSVIYLILNVDELAGLYVLLFSKKN